MSVEFDPKNMLFRNLGNSGLRVPVFSYGGWLTVGAEQKGSIVNELMKTAFECGINMFDNAEAYAAGESEREMGRAIKELKWDRRDIIVTTKIFFGTARKSTHNSRGLSRKHIVEGLNKSLENLQLDYVDIVFAHRPDLTTPMEETVRAFNHVIDTGKAFYWGTSEWTPMQIQQAIEIARRLNMIAPIAEQPQYNMFSRDNFESKMDPIWTREGYGSTVFSALAQGILTGKYNDGVPEDSRHKNDKSRFESEEGKAQLEKVRALTKIAEKLQTSVSNVALAWVLKHPNASTIILGATKPEQIRDNVKAVEIIPKLTPEIMAEIDKILDNKPKPQPSYGRVGDDGVTLV